MTAVVLSSENPEAVQRFYAARTNPGAPEPVDAEVVAETVESGTKEQATTEGKGSEQEQAPNPDSGDTPPSKVHVRFSELTEKAKAAEAAKAQAIADLEAERKARVLAEQQASELRAKHEPPKADPLGPKPKLEQFNNAEEFAAALEDWTTEKVTLETETRTKNAKRAEAWESRQTAAKADLPDYDEVIAAAKDLKAPNVVLDAIIDSDQGAYILHHLAKNPDVIGQMNGMTPEGCLRLIGRLEGKFEASRANSTTTADTKSAQKPATAAATEVSRAPAPITPLRNGTASIADTPVDSNGEFHGTFDQYKAARRAGKIK